MKIKRYTAASMRLALAQVRDEQGPEAVILSSRRIDEGIEVIAAVDYDETLIANAGRQRPPLAPARPLPAEEEAPAPTERSARPRTAAADDATAYRAMQSELQDLRRLLEGGFASLAWRDKRSREPLQARVLEELTALDLAADVAMSLAAMTPRQTRLANPARIALAILAKCIPLIDDQTCVRGGVAAVVGPTGVGKTTTIAKLAARWSVSHGNEDLALVSTDVYRIGAREQLSTYARILGVPMHSANSGKELAQLLERLKAKRLVLIDTAGFGPRDARLAEQISALRAGAPGARVLLALPAQGEARALQEICGAFRGLEPAACILTKLDEAASLGAALSSAIRQRLPIAYLCNGQRVPEDLHSAHRRRVWIARAAERFKQPAAHPHDESYFARHFGRAQAHA